MTSCPDPLEPAVRRPLGCRTNTRHVWQTTRTPDGELYRACARCGKEYTHVGSGFGFIGG